MEADDTLEPPATVNAAVDAVLVYATFPTQVAAELVAEAVVTKGLAAHTYPLASGPSNSAQLYGLPATTRSWRHDTA